MTGHDLHARLVAAGLSVTLDGPDIRLAPKHLFTDELRGLVKEHRPALISHLAYLATAADMQAVLDGAEEASRLLTALEKAGLRLRIDPDSPGRQTIKIGGGKLTPEQRAAIARVKPHLLRLLEREALNEEAGKYPTPFRGELAGAAGGGAGALLGVTDGVDGPAGSRDGGVDSKQPTARFVGWLRVPPAKKWSLACTGDNYGECWGRLLRVPVSGAVSVERKVTEG